MSAKRAEGSQVDPIKTHDVLQAPAPVVDVGEPAQAGRNGPKRGLSARKGVKDETGSPKGSVGLHKSFAP